MGCGLRNLMRWAALAALFLPLVGCGVLPQVAHQPSVHNPFPQLSKVAIVPFFNLSTEPSVDGRRFALAYFNELQAIRGFEVAPIGVVEQALLTHQLDLNGPDEARRLAELLGVDAVVIGAVTDFSPYYPQRVGLKVEWYAANPCYHPIPPGYGLPWGTAEEEEIPDSLIFEAEFALAKAQLETQTPEAPGDAADLPTGVAPLPPMEAQGQTLSYEEPPLEEFVTTGATDGDEPPGWPDPRGFVPPPPAPQRPACQASHKPVLQHTRIYHGNDADFTTALESYHYFRDEQRFGGWPAYLQNSEDLIRFSCHLHIAEMLTARGGAGKTRVVWRWPKSR